MNAVYAPFVSQMGKTIDRHEKKTTLDKQDPFYSEENMARLKESIHQMDSGQFVAKSWEELTKLANG